MLNLVSQKEKVRIEPSVAGNLVNHLASGGYKQLVQLEHKVLSYQVPNEPVLGMLLCFLSRFIYRIQIPVAYMFLLYASTFSSPPIVFKSCSHYAQTLRSPNGAAHLGRMKASAILQGPREEPRGVRNAQRP